MKIIYPEGKVEELTQKPSLEKMQEIVGGYIELIKCPKSEGKSFQLVANEEGKIKGLPFNTKASFIAGQEIVGTVILLEGKERP